MPGGGHSVVRTWIAGTGAPGWSGSPAPLSNSTLIGGSASYSARAAAADGASRNRSSGRLRSASKICCMISGANTRTDPGIGVISSATYRSRKVFHSVRFTGA